MTIGEERGLDIKGRCCGRKPLLYKRAAGPTHPAGYFCPRCNRSYDMEGNQQENWAWSRDRGYWVETYPERKATK